MTQIMKFPKDLKTNNNLFFTDEEKNLSKCNIFIITVPTPIKFNNLPDLNLLKEACETVGKYVKNSIVVIESTTYLMHRRICAPIVKKSQN